MAANDQPNMRPLLARDREEEHRSVTELELLFDLVFVVAIAAAAHGLRHEIAAGHIQTGMVKFLMAFFCVWWPWNQLTYTFIGYVIMRLASAALWLRRVGGTTHLGQQVAASKRGIRIADELLCRL